ncbi:U3 small nucleolar ribonucleoprotein IMP4 isoform X2 [Prunus yedoensis var. nudiflora]|uniref:U3 small nucleolar ribonucleoprotein IMP4 isoform X2 n=1 Tax=Prunus yedoensis var. nudiflora TaxID=2094558 RepID=A0A314ZFJ9_PRUYE|nr:U3 small nucleolar ribonucleoprotein IMP4 isoform X2 [Prunus yedoensis var. nudiflora]
MNRGGRVGLRGLVWKLGLRYVGRFGARSVCEIGLGCSVSSSCGFVENPDLLNLLYECNNVRILSRWRITFEDIPAIVLILGLFSTVTRHDIKDKKAMGTMPQVYPHLILDNFTTKLGERIANILKHLFPVPKPDTKRIITFSNRSDYISFRHHTYGKHGGPKSIELEEIGPRFEMKLFKIKMGRLDQTEAQMNSDT